MGTGRRRAAIAAVVAALALAIGWLAVPALRPWEIDRPDAGGAPPSPRSDATDADAAAPGTLEGRPAPAPTPAGSPEVSLPSPDAASLSGRVIDEAGRGVPGATVRLFSALAWTVREKGISSPWTPHASDAPFLATGTTGDDGAFRFEKEVPPGAWVLRAEHAEYALSLLKVHRTPRDQSPRLPTLVLSRGAPIAGVVVDGSGRGVPGARVLLASEVWSFGLGEFERATALADDVGRFRIRVPSGRTWIVRASADGFPPAASGPVTAGDEKVRVVLGAAGILEAEVADATDRSAIPGADVIAASGPSSPDGQDLATEATGRTDAAGTCRLTLPAGKIWWLSTHAPGHAHGTLLFGQEWHRADGMAIEGEEENLRVEAGETRRVRVLLSRGVTFAGRVRDAAGVGLEDVELRLALYGQFLQAATRSGADGAYRLEGVVPGRTNYAALTKPGWVLPIERAFVGASLSPDASGDVAHDFVMERPVVVRGTVVDEEGRGIPGARIRFDDEIVGTFVPEIHSFGSRRVLAVTAEDGSWTAEGQEDTRTYSGPPRNGGTAIALADGFVEGRSDPFPVAGRASIDVPPIRLSRGATVLGVVLDPEGRAVAGAKVEARSAQNQPWWSGEPQTTAADGSFALRDAPVRTLRLFASAAGFVETRRTVLPTASGEVARVEIRLRRPAAIRGRVLGAGGAPLAGAIVAQDWFSRDPVDDAAYQPYVYATADAQGEFALEGLAAGPVRIRVKAEGHRNAETTAEAGGSSVDVSLTPLTDAEKARVAELRAQLETLNREQSKSRGAAYDALQKRIEALDSELRGIVGDG